MFQGKVCIKLLNNAYVTKMTMKNHFHNDYFL